MEKEAQQKCVSAGMSLIRDHESFNKATPIIFIDNLKGLVTADVLKIPRSELALHVGAAGKDIIAFALTGRSSGIVAYDDGKGSCEYTFGSAHEIFQPALVEKVEEIWEKRGPG